MANVLEMDHISKTYNLGRENGLTVFSDLSLELKAGEVVGLIAPSGTGKSTLLHIAGLLDTPSQGQVKVDDLSAGDASDRQRTFIRRDQIGFVFQFHHLLGEFTALENIALPLRGAGWSKTEAENRAEHLLAEVGLGERANHRPGLLSGGEAQRVAIARALANRPKILLADEPTGNLDPENADRVFQIFVRLAREEGMTAMIATHNMDLAGAMDRVIDLRNL